MRFKNFEQELANDLTTIQVLISELPGKDYQAKFVPAGPFEQVDEKIKELIKKMMKLKERYKDSPVKISGFSVTLGAALINSSVSINFEF
jgi:surfactin synthase thioesterase subunit